MLHIDLIINLLSNRFFFQLHNVRLYFGFNWWWNLARFPPYRRDSNILFKFDADSFGCFDNLFEVFLILTELRRDAMNIVLKNLIDLVERSDVWVRHRDRWGMLARNLR